MNLLHAHLITWFRVCIRFFSVYVHLILSHLSLLSTFGDVDPSCVAIGHFQTFLSLNISMILFIELCQSTRSRFCFHTHFSLFHHSRFYSLVSVVVDTMLSLPLSHFSLHSMNISHIYEPFAWSLWLYFAHHILCKQNTFQWATCMYVISISLLTANTYVFHNFFFLLFWFSLRLFACHTIEEESLIYSVLSRVCANIKWQSWVSHQNEWNHHQT